jgi:cyclopropane fatty-acyl-phospholipid synthase-like methyltransferase
VQATTAAILAERAEGTLSAGMALTRLLLAHRDVEAVRRELAKCAETAPTSAGTARELARLLDASPDGARQVAAVLATAEHETHAPASIEDGLAACRRLFDRAVDLGAAASVAVYSLGDEERLAEATNEVVALLAQLGIVAPDRHLLDVGCGIGRFEAALAGRVASIVGIDLSPAMVQVAEERCRGLRNVRFVTGSGRDLAVFEEQSFDAVLAVDAFPYLYQAGGEALATAHVREAARVLRAPGDLVILNLSYRGDPARDQADARELAAAAGFELARNGSSDLRSWDGRTFHFRKPG